VKWDGCVDFIEYNEENGAALKQLHICGADDLDQLIQRLIEVRDMARAKFADHWYGEWQAVDSASDTKRIEWRSKE
jgi:hypothetical protein